MEKPWPDINKAPPIEPWEAAEKEDLVEGQKGGAKPWQPTKTFSDICDHRAVGFAAEYRDQWQALRDFHASHKSADTCPNVPFNVNGALQSWPVTHGSPFDWAACWKDLCWRRPRAHQPRPIAGAAAPLATITTSPPLDLALQPAPAPARMTDQQLALLNGMTGKDAPKKTRKQGVTAQTNTNNAAALPKCLDSVTEGGLYFVSLEPSINEGDLRVGLARAVESKAIAEGQAHEDVKVLVKWYARNEWLGSQHVWQWSDGPSFQVAKVPGTRNVWKSPEPLSSFLPVRVQLTPAALEEGREDSPKLLAVCTRFLRAVCVKRDLVHPPDTNPYLEESGEEESEEVEEEEEVSESSGEKEASESDNEHEPEHTTTALAVTTATTELTRTERALARSKAREPDPAPVPALAPAPADNDNDNDNDNAPAAAPALNIDIAPALGGRRPTRGSERAAKIRRN